MLSQAGEHSAILVVEDEPLVRLLIADDLRAAGYFIIEAGTADEALALFDAHADIALLITDIRMPGAMDGLDLARVIRARGGRTRIIVMSGQTSGAEAAYVSDAFIAKPYE